MKVLKYIPRKIIPTLSELFEAMKKSKEKVPDAKADIKALKSYFEKVYPELDFERVYASDMKKMVKWFHILEKNKIEIKVKTEEEKEAARLNVKTTPNPFILKMLILKTCKASTS